MCPGHSLSNGEEKKKKEGEKDICMHICMTDAAA